MKLIPRFRGPSLTLLAVVHILLFVASLVAAAALRHGTPFITPFAAADAQRAFFAQNPLAVQLGNFLLFGSAVPLGLFAVTAVSRLRYLRIRAAGTNIALFGGVFAAIAVAFSGLFGWVLSSPEVFASASTVKAFFFLSFLTGGAAFAVAFGLFAAGVSLTAYFSRYFPRWLLILGMVVAVAGEGSWFSLVAYPANFLIPIARYLGLVWMVLAAVRLMRSHPSIPATEQAVAR